MKRTTHIRRLLVVCRTDMSVDTFIKSNFIARLKRNYHVEIVFTSKSHQAYSDFSYFVVAPIWRKISTFGQILAQIKHSNKSPNLHDRVIHYYLGSGPSDHGRLNFLFGPPFPKKSQLLFSVINKSNLIMSLLISGISLIRPFFVPRKSRIWLKQFDLIISGFGGHYDSSADALISCANHFGVLTLGIQENWDHLSTKQYCQVLPRKFGVWSRQSASHLRVLYDFPETNIHIVGSLKHESLADQKQFSTQKFRTFDRKTAILFAGTLNHQFNEVFLQRFRELCEEEPQTCERIDFYFRPHPLSLKPNSSNGVDNERFLSLSSKYKCKLELSSKISWKNFDILIAGFSTTALEAAMNNLSSFVYLGNIHGEDNYPDSILDDWLHNIGLRFSPKIKMYRSLEEIFMEIKQPFSQSSRYEVEKLHWFLEPLDSIALTETLIRNIVFNEN